jgi:hypothetical protein
MKGAGKGQADREARALADFREYLGTSASSSQAADAALQRPCSWLRTLLLFRKLGLEQLRSAREARSLSAGSRESNENVESH